MSERLVVGLGERSYPIWVGDGILGTLGRALSEVSFPRRVAVVTDETVYPLYGVEVESILSDSGFSSSFIVLPDGEKNKNLQTIDTIYTFLLKSGYDRSSALIALGGGVVGDMTGFAAATYMRGVPFAQVPTTLLSQVDSSVGGKTGVNHPLGKNMIGAFYQPRHVHIDVSTLKTLSDREFAAGMAEVAKYGIIRDRGFFDWISDNSRSLQLREAEPLIHAVVTSCQIKANVVENDERENALRAILNYGHTFGHAVETLAGYGTILHGEAVAIGMVVAAELSREAGMCSVDDVSRIESALANLDLPVYPPDFSLQDYVEAMRRDKKVREGVLRFVLNRGIGDCCIQDIETPEEIMCRVLENLKTRKKSHAR